MSIPIRGTPFSGVSVLEPYGSFGSVPYRGLAAFSGISVLGPEGPFGRSPYFGLFYRSGEGYRLGIASLPTSIPIRGTSGSEAPYSGLLTFIVVTAVGELLPFKPMSR